MARKPLRKSLTDAEFNAISDLTRSSHLDESFDVYQKRNGDDAFKDFDEDRTISLRQGLLLLEDSIAYPLAHENLSKEQSNTLVNLFKEFGVGDDNWYDWLLSDCD